VGYGLEGALTDALSKRIIDGTIVPRFKQQDFYGGVTAGVDQIMRVLAGEPLPPPLKQVVSDDEGALSSLSVLFVIGLVLGWLFACSHGTYAGRRSDRDYCGCD